MTRAEKVEKRKKRAARRQAKRNDSYKKRIAAVSEVGGWIPLSSAERTYGDGWQVSGCWPDDSSPTGYSQKCSYDAWGTCQSPCNGDC
jgi:hypothetical protein